MLPGRPIRRIWDRLISALKVMVTRTSSVEEAPFRGAVDSECGYGRAGRVFVGRDQLISQVLRTLPNNSLFLSGEPGIGKTALLHQIERHLARAVDPVWTFFPVPVHLAGVDEDRFFTCLSDSVQRALAVQLSGLLRKIHPHDREDIDHRTFIHELRQVVHILDRQTTRRVKLVFLVDEIDRLNHFDPLVNQRLRSVFMTGLGEHLVAVAAGVVINRQWGREGSPWFNFFEEIEVGPLEPFEAVELITALARGRMVLDSAVIERMVELGRGRPNLLIGLCELLAGDGVEVGPRRPTLRGLDAAARILGESG